MFIEWSVHDFIVLASYGHARWYTSIARQKKWHRGGTHRQEIQSFRKNRKPSLHERDGRRDARRTVAAGIARARNGGAMDTGSFETIKKMERCCPRGQGKGKRAHLCLQDDQAGVKMLVLQVHVRRTPKRLSSFFERNNELDET